MITYMTVTCDLRNEWLLACYIVAIIALSGVIIIYDVIHKTSHLTSPSVLSEPPKLRLESQIILLMISDLPTHSS